MRCVCGAYCVQRLSVYQRMVVELPMHVVNIVCGTCVADVVNTGLVGLSELASFLQQAVVLRHLYLCTPDTITNA